jgi:hypothetical protein
MAAMLVPMMAMAGSAIDAARLYVVKVRLQQACDAGVLAGRKFMTGTGATIDDTAAGHARTFFRNNFATGWLGTSDTTFTPTKTSNSQVSGTAVTTVPMTLMKIFGITSNTMTVACQARFDVADTDVLFVLDTTGSMACLPAHTSSECNNYVGDAGNSSYTRPSNSNGVAGYTGTAFSVPESDNSRIDALRAAVLNFYDTFDSVKDPTTKVRYGFVTYASSVNVGKAIKDVVPSALVGSNSGDTAAYQSRKVTGEYEISLTVTSQNNSKSQQGCTSSTKYTRTPAATQTNAYPFSTSTGTATIETQQWNSTTSKCEDVTKVMGPVYTYAQYSWPVDGVVAGNTVTNPTKVRGQTMKWLGCIETITDTPGQTSFSVTSPPSEINPNASPTGAARWVPQMQDLAYIRNGSFTNNATDYTDGDNWYVAPGYGSDAYATAVNGGVRFSVDGDSYQKSGAIACGKPVKRLGVMTRSEVSNWVNAADFAPMGGTYHDIGMIWGARLIAPDGPWGTDTAAWPGRNAPNRVIVFLTDGDMAPTTSSYSMYGQEGYDRLVTNGNFGSIVDYHNKRFLAACAAAKAQRIDIWTVAIAPSASTTLESCASAKQQAQFTTSGTDLGDIFETIAEKLAMLRLSQ